MADILLAEDETVSRDLYQKFLTRAGHKVTGAVDGSAALEAFSQQSFDLVVTDIYMPDMTGIELIPQLRTKNPDILIIAISSGGNLKENDLGLGVAKSLGAHQILEKPFDVKDLVAAVATVLEDGFDT